MKLIWHYKKFEELTSKELYNILELRVEVFVVEQNCLYNECDRKDFKSTHLWCEMDGKVIAYCRILPPGVSYHEPSIGRVVSHPDFRHLKMGYQLMRHSLQIIENHFQTHSVRISAQSYLKSFYEKFGYQQVSEEYLEDDLPHMQMLKR
jgi:ElaA protein